MVHCYVPGCKTGYSSDIKKRKDNGEKRLCLFRAPRNEKELEKWHKSIERVDKKLKPSDRICELHFTEDNIVRYFETKFPDGTVWRLLKERISLKKGAVPTIFPNLQTVTNKKRSQKCLNSAKKCSKKRKKSSNKNHKFPKGELNEYPKDSCLTENVETVEKEQTETVLSETSETFSDNVLVNNLEHMSKPDLLPETFSYNALLNNLEHLSESDLSWSITVHEEFVMCAKRNDEDSALMKRVIINDNLKIQVFLKNKRIDFDDVKINSIEDLSSILSEVDKYGICRNADDAEKTECDGYIFPDSKSNQCECCQLVGDLEINTSKQLYWLSKGKNFTKHQKLYQKIHALNKNNALLKEQLLKMMKIKTIWKLSSKSDEKMTKR